MPETCVNGRINPSFDTKLRLFSDSAGYCNRPECRRYLFSNNERADYNIGEMAHIIAASGKGPRPDKTLDANAKADYNNLILLCPSCHTEIDKAPEIFPVELVLNWKHDHKKRINEIIGIPTLKDRSEGRTYISQIMRQNRAIFDALNPDLPYRENPQAEEADVWKRKMVTQIIPNNQKLLIFLDANSSLLTDNELTIVEEFRQHVDDLIERHFGDNLGKASRFPAKMNYLLKD